MNNVNKLFAELGVETVDTNGVPIPYKDVVTNVRTKFLALSEDQRKEVATIIAAAKKEIEVAYDAVNGLTDIK